MVRSVALSLCVVLSGAGIAGADVSVFSSGGSDADVLTALNSFRSTLGTLNPNTPGSQASGRREINWDAVGDAFSAPNAFPGNFLNANIAPRARGAEFSTPSGLMQVSANLANPSGALKDFGNVDPSYVGLFREFSPQRLFAPIGSTSTEVRFFVPGSSTPALTTGFGAIFCDVDVGGATQMRFYGPNGRLVYLADVPVSSGGIGGNEGFSFFGIAFDGSQRISRVEITTGTAALGAGVLEDIALGRDLVVMDDFVFGEPQNLVPAPGFAGMVLAGMALARRRR